uniref:uncharacterized protein n=1 Tax=Lonchura striata TaxID=40157 RepID=UPI000B4D99F2|nr:uncharacterized protein LOC110471348 [Lonchura striata domestica]
MPEGRRRGRGEGEGEETKGPTITAAEEDSVRKGNLAPRRSERAEPRPVHPRPEPQREEGGGRLLTERAAVGHQVPLLAAKAPSDTEGRQLLPEPQSRRCQREEECGGPAREGRPESRAGCRSSQGDHKAIGGGVTESRSGPEKGSEVTVAAMRWEAVLRVLVLQAAWALAGGQVRYSVPEEAKAGTVVGRLAQDLGLEAGEAEARRLRLVAQGRRASVEVSGASGALLVSSRLDREELCGKSAPCALRLEVLLERPLRVFHVELEVTDINDNAPVFRHSRSLCVADGAAKSDLMVFSPNFPPPPPGPAAENGSAGKGPSLSPLASSMFAISLKVNVIASLNQVPLRLFDVLSLKRQDALMSF